MIRLSNVRIAALLASLALVLTATLVVSHLGATGTAQGAGQVNNSEQQTTTQMENSGGKAYADRPPAVQAVMRAMYDNDRRYGSLSGLFVDEAPNDTANSIQLAIQQPYSVTADWYPNATGSGTPGEELQTDKVAANLYSPAKNVTTALTQIQNQPPLQPIDSVELGVVAGTFSPTDVTFSNGTATSLVNMFVHPASLITSSFFTYKDVQLAGTGTRDGRATWVLSGTQDPQAPSMALLGDGWRMEVDQQTGVVLRLDYLRGGKAIGWAGFQSFATTAPGAMAHHTLQALRIPAAAKTLSPQAYAQVVRSAG